MTKHKTQDVKILNFPKRNWLDYLAIISTFIALLIAFISLKMYYNETNKNPMVEARVYARKIDESDNQRLFSFHFQLLNKGNKISETTSIMLIYSPNVKINLDEHNNLFSDNSRKWMKDGSPLPYDAYMFEDRNLMLASGVNKKVGSFF